MEFRNGLRIERKARACGSFSMVYTNFMKWMSIKEDYKKRASELGDQAWWSKNIDQRLKSMGSITSTFADTDKIDIVVRNIYLITYFKHDLALLYGFRTVNNFVDRK